MNTQFNNENLQNLSDTELLNVNGGGWRDHAGTAAGSIITGVGAAVVFGSGPVGAAVGLAGALILSNPSKVS
ncbi:hypothetical protein VSY18_28070 (plasmid) [Bacillus albus]|uniref:Bacteriocin n=3 Tax=Bacillus cereus group TaxID=86661 RepID=A0A1C4F6K0_BACTU|nr:MULTISPECIES: hypothetical protein [Bacillus]ASZ69713.1 hypothetical protein CJ306_31405 [Bacillus cereus]EJR29665.1 hypothetical protein IIE_04905 [Bacillus cereus VD045]KLA26184.1 hypothetical protein B4077_6074 [Bacillus cereus]MBG9715254.1 hypothetical protein [Bacillus cereus]MCU4812724.1 hypothetical protein [Bacillus cereus]